MSYKNRADYNAWARKVYREDPDRARERCRKARQKAKDEAYAAYGGYKCNCCGETEVSFLTIDHINEDGSFHRKYIMKQVSGGDICYWLRKNNYPPGFQILCFNCNRGKYANGGVCPHKEKHAEYQFKGPDCLSTNIAG